MHPPHPPHEGFHDYGDSLLNLAQSDPHPHDYDSQDTQVERREFAQDLASERLQELRDHADELFAREQLEIKQRQADLETMRELIEALAQATQECAGYPITFQPESLLFADDNTVITSLHYIIGDTAAFYIGGTADVASRWRGAERRGRPLRPPRVM